MGNTDLEKALPAGREVIFVNDRSLPPFPELLSESVRLSVPGT